MKLIFAPRKIWANFSCVPKICSDVKFPRKRWASIKLANKPAMRGPSSAQAPMLDPFLIKLNCKQSHSPSPFPFPGRFWHAAEVLHSTLHRDTGQTGTSKDPGDGDGDGDGILRQDSYPSWKLFAPMWAQTSLLAVSLPLRLLSCQSFSPRIRHLPASLSCIWDYDKMQFAFAKTFVGSYKATGCILTGAY